MLKLRYFSYNLLFKRPAGTSRGLMREKLSYFLIVSNEKKIGVGECGLLKSLSIDPLEDYEERLKWLAQNINRSPEYLFKSLERYPSICAGLEQALMSLTSSDKMKLYPSPWTKGKDTIPTNALIWMGEYDFMLDQIEKKLLDGVKCMKLKIGGIKFDDELKLLKIIRSRFSSKELELRLDANGAFQIDEALEKLTMLSHFDIHSIEQPIKQGQWSDMKVLCGKSPIDIALDEELIGQNNKRAELLDTIKPQYIILKPSLLGGFAAAEKWISDADKRGIAWWVTSALESNVGLNALAQWTYQLNVSLPQGLGTGALYQNNIPSPLSIENYELRYDVSQNWDLSALKEKL